MDFEKTENPATEQVAENVEKTTEQTPKMFTQAEVDDIVGRRIARHDAKIRREYDREYGELMDVLKAGTGKQTVGEVRDTFKSFYEEKGVKIPEKPIYSDREIEVLARADAEDIIRSGYDDVVEEMERLAALGASGMNPREKVLFRTLADHRQNTERSNEFSKLGISAEVSGSKEFQNFVSMFNPNTPAKEIYEVYQKTIPKKNIKPMGSMVNTAAQDNGVKDFYSFEEASKFTVKDFDKNPKLYEAVKKSMTKW